MAIDWFTVGAQVVNFLILVGLLYRFLYGPVIRAMDRREQRIAQSLTDAAASRAAADAEIDHYRAARKALDAGREAMAVEARQEGEKLRHSLESEARREVAERTEKWNAEIEAERGEFLADIQQRTAHGFLRLAERALSDLAGASLEERIGETFVGRLRDLEGSEQAEIAAALERSGRKATVASASALPDALRATIGAAIRDRFGEIDLRFVQDPDIVCGIHLDLAAHRVSWSLNGYLADLAEEVDAALAAALDHEATPAGPQHA